jgi:hypothetical protein
MAHILLDLNGYIDLWLNPSLVHDLYLKSMEGHLLMEALEAAMKSTTSILILLLTIILVNMHFLLLVSPSMQHLLLLLMSGLLILKHLIIWLRIKPFLLLLMNVTSNEYLLVMMDLLVL